MVERQKLNCFKIICRDYGKYLNKLGHFFIMYPLLRRSDSENFLVATIYIINAQSVRDYSASLYYV